MSEVYRGLSSLIGPRTMTTPGQVVQTCKSSVECSWKARIWPGNADRATAPVNQTARAKKLKQKKKVREQTDEPRDLGVCRQLA
jgi:hypothetical protein